MSEEQKNVETVEEPKPSLDEQAEAAFAEGVNNAQDDDLPVVSEKLPEEKPAEVVAEKPDPAKPVEVKPDPTPEEKAAAEAKAKIEEEVTTLKLKGKTAERFRELSARPTKEEVEKQLAPVRELAQQAQQFNEIIKDTRANPDQIGTAFRYLKAINSGDREAMRGALKSMTEEVTWLAKTLGEPLPGFDPITEHADLNDRAQAGEITPEVAREVAAARAERSLTQAQREAIARENHEREEQKAAFDAAIQQVNTLNERLKLSDPNFEAKLQMLKDTGTIDLIRENMHPSRWPSAVEAAYMRLPNPAPKAPVTPMPLRPSGAPASTMTRTPKDAEDAFAMGVEMARAAGH